MYNFITVKDYRGELHTINADHIVEVDPNLPNEEGCSSFELSNGRRIIAKNEVVEKIVKYLNSQE